jgi:fatty acid desaturase
MRLEQESTARPMAAPKGRWSEYTQLSRQLKQAGLLDRRRGWYATKIGLNLALLAAGLVSFATLGDSWWQLVTAAYLAVVFTQIAFVGHDAGHRQLFRPSASDFFGVFFKCSAFRLADPDHTRNGSFFCDRGLTGRSTQQAGFRSATPRRPAQCGRQSTGG